MKTKALTRVSLAIAIAAMATSGFAQLSKEYNDFGNGPAQWIMTNEERAQWKGIKTDADAKAFVGLFWARRDPTPGTPRNEFKESFDQRVQYADEHFEAGRTRGSMTDPGRVIVVLGPPTRMTSTRASDAPEKLDRGPRAIEDRANAEDAVSGNAARMVMIYERARQKQQGNLFPEGTPDFEAGFVDQYGNKSWKLQPGKYDVFGLMNKVVVLSVVNPTLTQVPPVITGETTTTTKKTTTVTTTTPVAPVAGIKTAAIQDAVAAQKGGTSAINKGTSASYAEFVSPSGDFYVPLGIMVPKSANLAADSVDTVFGQVEDANGAVVTSFEEPVKPTMSNGALFADRSVTLPTGKYTAIVGVAKAGAPVAIATESLDVTGAAKDTEGISNMALTNNLAEIPEAAPEKTGFAFGKMKVIPTTTFAKSDELIFFIEVRNPGIDPATNGPKIQTKLELSGGKLAKPIPRQLMDAQPAPLSGKPGPGQYAIIDSIPLGQIPTLVPGDYTLKVKVVDTVTKQSYETQQSFKIVG
ncbi:MAG TPA: GWxTD domain-containing protein [Thermoanaerobaculia bacterium]